MTNYTEILQVIHETVEPSNYTIIPNCLFEILNPYEFRVYAEIKKNADNDEKTSYNYEKIAENCGISIARVHKIMESFCQPKKELGGKSLITKIKENHGYQIIIRSI